MKKWIIAVIGLVCFAPVCFADNWGVGLRVGAAQNDPKDMQEVYDEASEMGYSDKKLTKVYGALGLEVLYEWDLNSESNKLGVKVGADVYGQNKLKLDQGMFKATETTYAIPVTIYYKNDNGAKNWSWFVGAGVTWIRSEMELDTWGYGTDKYSENKVFPHVTVGAEYRFTQVFALGLDVKYNIDAKVTKDGDVLSDRSGIGGGITARFYF